MNSNRKNTLRRASSMNINRSSSSSSSSRPFLRRASMNLRDSRKITWPYNKTLYPLLTNQNKQKKWHSKLQQIRKLTKLLRFYPIVHTPNNGGKFKWIKVNNGNTRRIVPRLQKTPPPKKHREQPYWSNSLPNPNPHMRAYDPIGYIELNKENKKKKNVNNVYLQDKNSKKPVTALYEKIHNLKNLPKHLQLAYGNGTSVPGNKKVNPYTTHNYFPLLPTTTTSPYQLNRRTTSRLFGVRQRKRYW